MRRRKDARSQTKRLPSNRPVNSPVVGAILMGVNITISRTTTLLALLLMIGVPAEAQRKRPAPRTTKPPAPAQSELARLRDDYIKVTKEYKASLEKLLSLYEASQRKTEEKLARSKDLFAQGLISRKDLEESERAVTVAKLKADGVRQQMSEADAQIAQVLVELETEKQIKKGGRLARGGMVSSTAFIRYNGVGAWALSEAGKIQSFFQQRFGRPLPIAVLGQGTIHNQWHLDHRNAMDVSVYPDTVEGQALMDYLRSNGIPFSAFRQAIPGTATGPHIHIGKPSHRY